MPLQTDFSHQLALHCPHQHHFVIGLSGGVDSVVLLHLFSQYQKQQPLHIRAVHIHHGLSTNADSWATFCSTLCERYGIPLTVCKVKVEGKQGLEANARQVRYHAIRQQLQPNEMLVTAHHLDDQVETFFLALKRGSGLKGLGGMQAVSFLQKMAIFRPLLAQPKATLVAYAKQHQLQWIEDESNANTDFERNFLRNAILPQLNQRWLQFSQMVARTSQHCAEQQRLIEALLADELHHRIDGEQRLNIAGFAQFSPLKQQQLIRLWLAQCHVAMPSVAQLAQIVEKVVFAEKDKNPQLKLGKTVIRRYQQQLWLTEPLTEWNPMEWTLKQGDKLTLPEQIGEIWHQGDGILFCKKSGKTNRLSLPESLKNQRVSVKFSPAGKVKCYGKPQREEMKKIWQQHCVPVWLRSRTPLVFLNDTLIGLLT